MWISVPDAPSAPKGVHLKQSSVRQGTPILSFKINVSGVESVMMYASFRQSTINSE